MYTEFSDDPKVQMMPENFQRRLIMLFCARCKFQKLVESEMPEETAETKSVFVEKGFIDNDWNVIHWDKRQFISDNSASRTRAYRQNVKRHSDGDM
jgi:hypothetical protein